MRARTSSRSTRSAAATLAITAITAIAAMLLGAAPAAAAPAWLKMPEMPNWEWEDSRAMKVTATMLDATIVRPVATMRVLVGGMLFLPAALLSAPMGREGFDSAYQALISDPIEYAFDRPLGEL